jgi:hypothetical protein
MKIKYDIAWAGIDAGREGLWREPVWSGALRIIGRHSGAGVYDPKSPIYTELESSFPDEKWRSYERGGNFRPLFRDYPNPWTKTDVVRLTGKEFKITARGKLVLKGAISKQQVLVGVFSKHLSAGERPFVVLAHAFLNAARPLSTNELYWGVMKGWRPGNGSLETALSDLTEKMPSEKRGTPQRRLRNLLSLLRTAEAIQSHLRSGETWWVSQNKDLLQLIVETS